MGGAGTDARRGRGTGAPPHRVWAATTAGNRAFSATVFGAMTNELDLAPTRPRFTAIAKRAAAMTILLVVAAACSPAASPSGAPGPSGGPTDPPASPTQAPLPSATPESGGYKHPTGAGDVILRMEESGGFAPIEFFATHAPSFTLYGDGTVVWRDPTIAPPDPIGSINRLAPFLTIRLDEEGIQALLAEAIGPGALGVATGPYMGLGADMISTTFTVTADGRTKSVTFTGFLPDLPPNEAVIVAALAQLAERLQGLAGQIAGEQVYIPATYRGVLMPVDQAFGAVAAWPWADITPSDFAAGENTFQLTRVMTLADIEAMDMPPVEGGFSGLTLKHGGKLYAFALRPLLPDEAR